MISIIIYLYFVSIIIRKSSYIHDYPGHATHRPAVDPTRTAAVDRREENERVGGPRCGLQLPSQLENNLHM